MRLLVYAINIKIRDIFSNTHLGPNEIILKVDTNGFTIRIYSFNKSIRDVLLILIKGIQKIEITENEFHVIKEEMQKQFDGTINIIPKLKAIVNFFSIVLKSYIPGKDIVRELNQFANDKEGADNLNDYFKLLCHSYLYFFYHGDISNQEAINISLEVEKEMLTQNSNIIYNFNIANNDFLKLNPHHNFSGNFVYRELQGNDFNYDHATVNFYKIGENNIKNLYLTNIISSIIGYIYFTELRIKQQLGYTTSGKAFSEGNYLYFMIFVQGSRVEPYKVDIKIDELIPLMRLRLEQANEKAFKKALSTSISKLKLKDKSLVKRTERLNSILLKNLNMVENILDLKELDKTLFNQVNEAKKLQKTVTKQEVLDFFDSIFIKNINKISIQEYSNKVKELPIYIDSQSQSNNTSPIIIDSTDYFRKLEKNRK